MRVLRKLLIPLICVALGYCVGWLVNSNLGTEAHLSIVAAKWSDGTQENDELGVLKSFYGAQVYTVPIDEKHFSVRGQVWIGGGGTDGIGYSDDLGELGTAANWDEAVKTWGQIDWSDTALTIGPGKTGPVVVPRTKIQNHR